MEKTRFTKLFVIALFTITIQVISIYVIPENKQELTEIINNGIDETSSYVTLDKVNDIDY